MNFVRRQMDIEVTGGGSAGSLSQHLPVERKWPIHYQSVATLAILADLATIIAASIVAGMIYQLQASGPTGDISKSIASAVLVAALFISFMRTRGMYRPAELLLLRPQLRALVLSWTAVFLMLAGIVFTLKIGSEISRGGGLLFAVVGLLALLLERVIWRNLLSRGLAEKRFSGRKVLLITDHPATSGFSLIRPLTNLGFRVESHFRLPAPSPGSRNRDKVIARVIERIRGSDIEEIIVGADLNRWIELRKLIADLRVLPLPVNLIPVGPTADLLRRPSRELGNAICVELQRGPLTPLEYTTKRAIDFAVAATLMIALAPLLAIVAVAIKLESSGPVLFRQRRCGFNGRQFEIYKFRTMSVMENGATIIQAKSDDARVTRVGYWLRRTSIDELPQLLNVLEGSMSLVGPRPHAIAHDNQFDKMVRNYAFRRCVKPGLTGWAQVHGCRGPTPDAASVERRVAYDLWYVDNWSLTLDLVILFQTPLEVLRARNAY